MIIIFFFKKMKWLKILLIQTLQNDRFYFKIRTNPPKGKLELSKQKLYDAVLGIITCTMDTDACNIDKPYCMSTSLFYQPLRL